MQLAGFTYLGDSMCNTSPSPPVGSCHIIGKLWLVGGKVCISGTFTVTQYDVPLQQWLHTVKSHTNSLHFLPPSYTTCKLPPHHQTSINLCFIFSTDNNKSHAEGELGQLPQNSRVPCFFLMSGYCLCGVSYHLSVAVWVSYMYSYFLQPTKNMPVSGLALLMDLHGL